MLILTKLYLAKSLKRIFFLLVPRDKLGFPGGSVARNLPANAADAGDTGSVPGSGRSSGEGNGNQLQYSCLENHKDKGDLQATVHSVAKRWT